MFREHIVRIIDGVKITYSDLDESKRITGVESDKSYTIVVDENNNILYELRNNGRNASTIGISYAS